MGQGQASHRAAGRAGAAKARCACRLRRPTRPARLERRIARRSACPSSPQGLETVHGRGGGLAGIAHVFDHESDTKRKLEWRVPPDILAAIKQDRTTWKHFEAFPESYKQIRIGWIDAARRRPEIFLQRLRHFLKMTAQNKRFGMVQ